MRESDSRSGGVDPALALRRKAEEAAASLPDLLAGSEGAPPRALSSGAHARRRGGSGEKFWQFRDYDPADRPQDIDWRQSAKGERIFVRQKEHQAPRTIFLWHARGPGMTWSSRPELAQKDEAARILCLAAALLLARGGERVGLAGSEIRPGHGENTLEKIARALAAVDAPPRALPEASLADLLPEGCGLLAAGDFLAPPEEVARAFESCGLGGGRVLVLQILDPAERALPYDGRILFRDPASGESVPVEDAAGVREAYRLRIAEHIETLRDLCRKRHWHYILHDTSIPPRETLAKIRAAISAETLAAGAWDA